MVTLEYEDEQLEVTHSEFMSMFALESDFEVVYYCSPRRLRVEKPNQSWLLREFLSAFVQAGVVAPVMDGPNMVVEECDESDIGSAVLVDIIHPDYNDGGYSPFGDFCRKRLGQQCQYGSRYILGRIEGYPALGEGLRFLKADGGDYHQIRIHRDDMDEFERRYRAYCEERLNR